MIWYVVIFSLLLILILTSPFVGLGYTENSNSLNEFVDEGKHSASSALESPETFQPLESRISLPVSSQYCRAALPKAKLSGVDELLAQPSSGFVVRNGHTAGV